MDADRVLVLCDAVREGLEAPIEQDIRRLAAQPRVVRRRGVEALRGSAAGVDTDTDTGGDSPITSVVADVIGGSDDGLGPVLTVILGVSLLAAIAFVLLRRRGATGE